MDHVNGGNTLVPSYHANSIAFLKLYTTATVTPTSPDSTGSRGGAVVSLLLVSMDIKTRTPPPCPLTPLKEKNPLTRRLKSLFVHRLGLFIESEPDVLALVLNALHCTAGAKVNCGVVDQISLHISPTGDIHLAIALPARGSKQSRTHCPGFGKPCGRFPQSCVLALTRPGGLLSLGVDNSRPNSCYYCSLLSPQLDPIGPWWFFPVLGHVLR